MVPLVYQFVGAAGASIAFRIGSIFCHILVFPGQLCFWHLGLGGVQASMIGRTWFSTIQYNTIQYNTIQYSIVCWMLACLFSTEAPDLLATRS